MQPAELLIICGSGLGIVLVSNSPAVIRKVLAGIALVFRPGTHDSKTFVRHLRLLYEIFVSAQRPAGMLPMEADIA